MSSRLSLGNGSWDGDTLSLFHLPLNNILYPGSLWFSRGRGRTMGRLVRCACNSVSSPLAWTSCQAPLRVCRDVPRWGRLVYFCCLLRTGLVGVLFPGGGSRPNYVRGCDWGASVSGSPSRNTSLRGMDSEKWSLGVPGSARGGVGTVSPFLLGRFSEWTGEVALWSGLGMGHLGSDTVGGGRCSVVVVVAPSKQGGCWLCPGSCVLLTPFCL